jgi:hypothetical protein
MPLIEIVTELVNLNETTSLMKLVSRTPAG